MEQIVLSDDERSLEDGGLLLLLSSVLCRLWKTISNWPFANYLAMFIKGYLLMIFCIVTQLCTPLTNN